MIPAPVVYDAYGNYADDGIAYYTVEGSDEGFYLTVTVDPGWMNDGDRAYPVVIDPTISEPSTASATLDTYLDSSQPDSSHRTRTYIAAGHGALSQEFIGYWELTTLPTLPADSTITSAIVKFKINQFRDNSAGNDSLTLEAHQITSSWTSYLTWDQWQAGTLGQFSSTAVSDPSTELFSSSTEANINITTLARDWYAGSATNYGIAIRQYGTYNIDTLLYSSDCGAESGNLPVFTLTYTIPTYNFLVNGTAELFYDLYFGSTATLAFPTIYPNQTVSSIGCSSATIASFNSSTNTVTPLMTGSVSYYGTISYNDGEPRIASVLSNINVCFTEGIYYLCNAGSYLLASTEKSIKTGNTVWQYGSYTLTGTTEFNSITTEQLSRMWCITKKDVGSYEIRSMLNASNYYLKGYSDGSVDLSITESPSARSYWRIRKSGSYYSFTNVYYSNETQDKVLSSPSGNTQNYVPLELQVYTGSGSDSQQRWLLTKITSIPSRIFLYRNDPGQDKGKFIESTKKYYVAVGDTLTLEQSGVSVASCCCGAPTDPVINWSSISSSVTVSGSTGDVTGIATTSGSVSISASSAGYTGANYNLQVIPIANGTYFVKNEQLLNYLQIDDGESPNYTTDDAILELWEFDGGNYQRWNITHVHDGYYKIESVKSSMAISVKSGEETSSEVSVVQQTYISSDRQKWKIIETANGNYKFKARSSEGYAAYDLCMAAADASNESITNNRAVKQRVYSSGNSKDEWRIYYKEVSYVNYYDSTFVGNSALINNISLANSFSAYAYDTYYKLSFKTDGYPTQYATIIDECTCGSNVQCNDSVCGTECNITHHKNVHVISNQIYNETREQDHIYVLWTNHAYATYCTETSNIHTTVRWIAVVYDKRPVIHFMTIAGNSNVQLACMCLNLVHETAHSLKMNDVYNVPGHDGTGTNCVMERFDSTTAYAYYLDVINGFKAPFCSSCDTAMRSLVSSINIPGN